MKYVWSIVLLFRDLIYKSALKVNELLQCFHFISIVPFEMKRTKLTFSHLFAGASNGDTITPDKTEEFVAEGSNVTLSCSYSSARSLLWYRHYPGSAPEYLVLISEGSKQVQTSDVDQRFSTNIRKEKQKHVDLIISSAAVSDSTLYYCALTPTVTGNTRTLYKNLNNGLLQTRRNMTFKS